MLVNSASTIKKQSFNKKILEGMEKCKTPFPIYQEIMQQPRIFTKLMKPIMAIPNLNVDLSRKLGK